MASTPLTLVTPRDLDLFRALERTPLTVRQLLRLSTTFARPFTTERRVQERLRALCAAGRVRRWIYATAGQGALGYYTLTPLGYRLLHGPDAVPPVRGLCGPVGIARQRHTRHLAAVIVHLLVAAHRAGLPVERFHRENALALRAGEETLYPDCTLALRAPGGTLLTFYVELDNATETVRSGGNADAWERKLRFYEAYQNLCPERFRVLGVTSAGPARRQHLLSAAAAVARDPRRSLLYGVTLEDLLGEDEALQKAVFRDHRGRPVALVPPGLLTKFVSTSAAVLASAACPSSPRV